MLSLYWFSLEQCKYAYSILGWSLWKQRITLVVAATTMILTVFWKPSSLLSMGTNQKMLCILLIQRVLWMRLRGCLMMPQSSPSEVRECLVLRKRQGLVSASSRWPYVVTVQKIICSVWDLEDSEDQCSSGTYYSDYPLAHRIGQLWNMQNLHWTKWCQCKYAQKKHISVIQS